MKLHEFLKNLRLGYNLSQVEISEKLGITQATYSKLESGKGKPSFKVVRKIAKFSGMTEKEVRTML